MLVILLTVLVQDNQPFALFMDEPEISLHVEWQQRLISLIRSLNLMYRSYLPPTLLP